MYYDAYPVSLRVSADFHSALAERWPETSFGIPGTRWNIGRRFWASAKRFVLAFPYRKGEELVITGKN
jgi:hypothetical protein